MFVLATGYVFGCGMEEWIGEGKSTRKREKSHCNCN